MPYIIQNSQGNAIVIPDGGVNQDYSIDLVGRNTENYGQYISKTQIDLLDNFASSNAPIRPTSGQLWYDLDDNVLRVFNASQGGWTPLTPIMQESTFPPNNHAQYQAGSMYYNKDVGQLFIHDGSSGYLRTNIPGEVTNDYDVSSAGTDPIGHPATYGTKIRNIFLHDTDGVKRAVLAVVYVNSSITTNRAGSPSSAPQGETLLAVFSGHDEFTVANQDVSRSEGIDYNYYDELQETGGIGIQILPGANYRSDNKTRVEVANVADRANTSYALNLGSYGADAANITASQVFYNSADSIPSADDTYDLGSGTENFAEIHGTSFVVGNGTTGSISIRAGSSADIGANAAPFTNGYFTNLTVHDTLTLGDDFDLGSLSDRIGNIFVDNLNANSVTIDGYTMPTSAGTAGQTLYIQNSGQVFWEEPASDIADISGGGGMTVQVLSNPNIGPNNEVTRRFLQLDIGAGTGITVNADDIEVDMTDFTTNDLAEHATNNLYFTTSRARASISAGGDLSYNNVTGEISYTEPTMYNDSDARSAISVSDGGGDGSLAYNSSTGVITYTGPSLVEVQARIDNSAANVRAHFSGGTGINITGGTISTTGVVYTTGNQTIAGTKSFSSAIDADGGIEVSSISANGSDTVVDIEDNLTVSGTITATGDITAFSDEALKDNFQVIGDALNKVAQLTGYTYDRKDINVRQTGLIAQQVKEILPEAVKENEDGMHSLAYGNLVGLLVEAIKDLKAEITDLKNNIR